MTFKSERTGAKPLGDRQPDAGGSFIPWRTVAAELGVCTRSLARWEKADPLFPPVIKINDRRYLTDTGFADYKAALIRRGLSA